jgi:hypothetical protein
MTAYLRVNAQMKKMMKKREISQFPMSSIFSAAPNANLFKSKTRL